MQQCQLDALAPHGLLLQCLKYKTDQQVDVKKMEKLNNMFFALMARGEYTPGAASWHVQCIACSDGIWYAKHAWLHNTHSCLHGRRAAKSCLFLSCILFCRYRRHAGSRAVAATKQQQRPQRAAKRLRAKGNDTWHSMHSSTSTARLQSLNRLAVHSSATNRESSCLQSAGPPAMQTCCTLHCTEVPVHPPVSCLC